MFADAGAYTVSHRVSDDPTGGNSALEGYIRWSGTDEYEKLILAQNRPAAAVTASLMQKPSDSSVCLVNVIYDSSDPDHPSDAKKGIREERFFYKEAGETEWTEGRFPSEVEMGTTYLVRYEAKDIEGTWSYPAVASIKTNEAREYVRPDDTTPPVCILTVSRDTAEAGETIYIEAEAADDYGVAEVTLEINGTQAGTKTGRYAYTPDEPGETEIVLTAADICGNIGTAAKTVMVYDRSDVTPPVIDIVSPKSGMVSGSIDIMGSITDNKKLAEYKIMLDRVVTDTQDSRSEDGQNENEDSQNENDGNQNEGGQNEDDQNGNEGSQSESILIADGTEAVRDAKIATLDTTELAQGMYRIEITAKDKAGNSSASYLLITVVKDHTADRIPPTAVIDSVTSDEEGSAIEVIGTVTDETGLAGYTLKAYHELQNGGYGDEVLSVSGGSEKIQEVLAGIDTDGLASGSYILVLTAVDGAGNTTSVTEKFTYDGQAGNADIVTRGQDNEPPLISATAGAEIKNGNLDIDFKGTIYDDSALLYTVTFGKKTENGNLSGALVIAAGNENIENGMIASYSFSPYEEAVYALVAEAEDEYGNSTRKEYIIRVTPNGTVYEDYDGEDTESDEDDDSVAGKLYIVPARTMADTSESISVYITYPDTAGNVKLVLRDRKTDEETEIPVHGTKGEACAENAGEYEIILSAYINGARKSVSADVWFTDKDDDVYPAAVFTSPEEESVIKTATDIRGTVNDDKLLKYYTLEYRQKGTDEYTEISRGTEPVTDGVLGTLDTTMLLNGRYELRLTAVDMGGHVTRTERYINVEGNLKVGNMSIGFTDITSNVAGIPLALTRNYDSRNKASGDFGTGWSMGLMDIRLTESSDIVSGYSMAQTGEKFSTAYYITQTMCHDITVTYGDGTSDRFVLTVSPERQAIIPIYEVNVGFRCVTNPKVKLSLNGDSSALLYGSSLMFEDTEMMEYHSYILTREDGSRLYLDEQRGLLFMEDTNGNRVSVTNAGFRHSDGKGITFTRDAKNRIIKAEETDSSANVINTVEYAYDSNDNLISVTDNAGRAVGYTYDDDHNLKDIIDPSGAAIARNEYDEDGRLVATIDADGNRIEYEHDIDGRTEAVKDRRGNTTVYTYDDNGNVLKTVDALGNVTVNTYDNNNNILTKTDALGNVTSYKYDSNNNLITTVNKEGIEISSVYQDNKIVSIIKDDILFGQFGYDYNGNVSSVTDANGNTTELTYDSKGNMLSATDKIGVMMSYKYDSNGNVSEAKDANGNIILYTRDESGRCIKTSTLRTTSSGTENIEAYYSYDSDGNIVSKTDPLGNATHYNYDVLGNLSSLINSDGNETKYEYDSLGNLVKITYCDNTFETFVYDANGNTISATNTYGQTVYMAYDKVGRMISKTYENGGMEKYKYDAVGNIIETENADGAVTRYEYDAMGRNIAVTDAYENRTEYEYDMDDNITKVTDAKGNVFKYEYDLKGNCTKQIMPDDGTTVYVYDARGRMTKKTDAEGNSTEYEYDNAGNLIKLTDALGNCTSYQYDERGNLTEITDALGSKTKYEYDSMSRMTKEINATGAFRTYEYNGSGNITKFTDFSGNITEYVYDDIGRLEKKIVNGEQTLYNYEDEEGSDTDRIVSVTDKNGTVHYSYDNDGRIISKTDTNQVTVGYEYTLSGKVKKITTPYGSTSYQYDLLERLVRVVDHNGNITVYAYDSLGNRTSLTYANGIKMQYTYDVCSHLIQEEIVDSNENIIKKYIYRRDKNGYPVSVEEVSSDSTLKTEYEYDAAGKLTKETMQNASGSIATVYTYDAVGNRLSKLVTSAGDITGITEHDSSQVNALITYTYNANHQLIKEVCGANETVYTYDLNGNLVSVSNAGSYEQYEYNSQNKLSKYYSSDGNIYTYTYDYEGNRTGKSDGTDEIKYIVDSTGELSYVLAETNGNGVLSKYYTRGTELISMEKAAQILYYLFDGHGSVIGLSGSMGNVSDTYRYDAYGNLIAGTGTIDNVYLYNCEEYDKETGLYYLRARYMDPETGTFTQRDTYQGDVYDAVSLHKYLYASANPVVYKDPSGYFSFIEIVVTTCSKISTISSNAIAAFKIKKWVDQITVIASLANIGLTVYDLMTKEQDKFSIIQAALNIGVAAVTIATIFAKSPPVAIALGLGAYAFGADLGDLINAIKERNYSQIIIKTIFVTVDFISLRYGYADNKFQQALEQHRADLEKSPIQQKLIDLTKNIIKNGDIDYEFVKDTLYNIAGKAEYDMFEDIWNLINHLGR